MKLKIEINTNNAAFLEDTPAQEIDYVLQGISQALKLGITDGPCHDHNGNTVGRWSWS